MACLTEWEVQAVTIEPGEGYLGYIQLTGWPSYLDPEAELDRDTRVKLEHNIMIIMAGQAAECILVKRKVERGYWRGGSGDDYQCAFKWMHYLQDADMLEKKVFWKEHVLLFDLTWLRTVRTLKLRQSWVAVEAIAKALLKRTTLDGEEIEDLYFAARRRRKRRVKN